MWQIIKKTVRPITTVLLVIAFFLAGFPSSVLLERVAQTIIDRNIVDSLYHAMKDPNVIDKGLVNLLRPRIEKAHAATFQMQTGYYIGNGAAKSITGLGFKPELILLKPNTTAGAGAVFKTKAMPVLNSPYFVATADTATGQILLDSDGFTVNTANTNSANVGHTWVAFTGSDCSASGTFCVGSYIGNGTSPRAITTGFQPNLVWVKQSTAVAGNWRSSSMPTNYGQYFAATTQETTGALFTTLDATSFTVGATNNASAGIYYYVAFKNVSGAVNVGTYAGNATDNRNITGIGFVPNFVFLKNADAATAVSAVYNVSESYGDYSSYYTDTANAVDLIQTLQTDGFQVGAGSTANGSGNTIYYAAFGGAASHSSNGTFEMANGSYTGTGNYQVISGLDFKPDLIIIKGDTTQAGVFRTRMITGDSTAYLDSATANFAGGIISLNADGFTIGTNATVNTSAVTYYWTAYGNAWNPDTNSGAADFFIGAYYGNGIDSRNITRLPFQPNMVTVKRSGATGGTLRTSAHSGDLSSFFAGTAEAANNIQVLNSDGFQVGTAANVNTAANYYWYFGFKSGTNFTVNTYSGTGSAQNITTVGFQPDNIWVKHTGATRGVERTSNMAADSALPFINIANLTGAIAGIISTGFSVGTAAETNTSGTNNYRYMAWRKPTTNAAPTLSISQPDGVDDVVNVGDLYNITYTLSDTDDVVTAAFYYDTNITGLDGTAISGACATAAEGTNSTCSWDTTGMTPGSYYVYGITNDGVNPQVSAYSPGQITINAAGTLTVDIVDSGGTSVPSPTMGMGSVTFSFTYQTANGAFGVSMQKIRVNNTTANSQWSLTMAANSGPTAFWDGAPADYDFNDPTANAGDGGDADNLGGQMTVNPSGATIIPQGGCNTTGLTLGSSASYSEGVTNTITLLTAGASAGANCYWDTTGIAISQTIPKEQPVASDYDINMTLTVTAI